MFKRTNEKSLHYELGEMTAADGSALWYTVETKASEYAVQISQSLKSLAGYQQLSRQLPSRRLLTYFQYLIRKEIYPFIRQACVVEWYRRNNKQIAPEHATVSIPKSGVLPGLLKCWHFQEVPVKLVCPWRSPSISKEILRKHSRAYLKRVVYGLLQSFDRAHKRRILAQPRPKAIIACHYAEGVDTKKRNDLNWFAESKINPENILLYLDRHHAPFADRRQIKQELIDGLRQQGFKCLVLERNVLQGHHRLDWYPAKLSTNLLIKKKSRQSQTEKWLTEEGNRLLELVHYWSSFYADFNIKIHYIPEEGRAESIAQAIAFDLGKEKSGLLIGKQRSVFHLPNYNVTHHPKHLFFTWNNRVKEYLDPKHGRIDTLITTGYQYNNYANGSKRAEQLKSQGAKFIITLFDNIHGSDWYLSTSRMTEFYQSFLQWLIDDLELGLIIKSKKPIVIQNLPAIHSLLKQALSTQRCIKIEEHGWLASEAAYGSDMAVGLGISSALIESVITGTRGVSYDMTNYRSHEFYRWGYQRVIFDNLQTLMIALRQYRQNPTASPHLGDWFGHLDDLDCFCDGQGAKRMGTYLRWLLEGFRQGKSRRQTIEHANRLYQQRWGEDKIINLNDGSCDA